MTKQTETKSWKQEAEELFTAFEKLPRKEVLTDRSVAELFIYRCSYALSITQIVTVLKALHPALDNGYLESNVRKSVLAMSKAKVLRRRKDMAAGTYEINFAS